MATKSTTNDFISKSQLKHCRQKYDYKKVIYVNNKTPVCIICPKHGEFLQTPNNHLNGAKCPECAKICRLSFFRSNTEKFIKRAVEVHGTLYDYSKSVYGNNNMGKIIIVCSKHGEFLQTPNDHLDGCGCPICGKEKNTKSRTKTTELFIEEAKNIWRNFYDYSKSNYVGCDKKVIIICPKHGEFLQTPNNHVNSQQGCPKCNMSKGELKVLLFLDGHNISYIRQHWFSDCRSGIGKKQILRFDFYVPSKNLLIEYNGKQHYKANSFVGGKHNITKQELTEIRYRDKIKSQYAKQNDIRLLRIKYTQFNRIDKILESVMEA
jgi:hypothetical protein